MEDFAHAAAAEQSADLVALTENLAERTLNREGHGALVRAPDWMSARLRRHWGQRPPIAGSALTAASQSGHRWTSGPESMFVGK